MINKTATSGKFDSSVTEDTTNDIINKIQNLPTQIGDFYLKNFDVEEREKKISLINYIFQAINDNLKDYLQEYLSVDQINNLFETLKEKLINLDEKSSTTQQVKEVKELCSDINDQQEEIIQNVQSIQDQSFDVAADYAIKEKIVNITSNITTFLSEPYITNEYVSKILLSKIVNCFTHLPHNQKKILKNKLKEIRLLWEVNDINMSNFFKRSFLKNPKKYLSHQENVTKYYIAFNDVFDQLLLNSDHQQVEYFASSFFYFDKLVDDINKIQLKAYNACVELQFLDTNVFQDTQDLVMNLGSQRELIQSLQINNSIVLKNFFHVLVTKIELKLQSLIEEFVNVITKQQKLPLIHDVKNVFDRNKVIEGLNLNNPKSTKAVNLNRSIGILEEILKSAQAINVDINGPFFSDTLNSFNDVDNLNDEQKKIIENKYLEFFSETTDLFQGKDESLINHITNTIFVKYYSPNIDKYKISRLIMVGQDLSLIQKDEELIRKIILKERQNILQEQIAKQISQINFSTLFSKDEKLNKILPNYIQSKIVFYAKGAKSPEEYINKLIAAFVSDLSVEELSKIYKEYKFSQQTTSVQETLMNYAHKEIYKRSKFMSLIAHPFSKKYRYDFLRAREVIKNHELNKILNNPSYTDEKPVAQNKKQQKQQKKVKQIDPYVLSVAKELGNVLQNNSPYYEDQNTKDDVAEIKITINKNKN